MKAQDYHIRITINGTAHAAFESINSVTRWWTENLEGNSQKLNDEFTVRFGDVHYSRQKLIEVVPDKKVVWLVTDSQLNFIKDNQEWTNTKIVFEILTMKSQTQIHFTHVGLIPDIECYEACSNAWSQYMQGSLLSLINSGEGRPTGKEKEHTSETANK